ncbi:Uma2 family endonuclease [Thermoactinospora rubra]|uniref:Uma2 family endonuclease n=1 Tax=Thermoactinospora rubra TaxID=1088767 RepID=UPI000A0F68CA|nr:Uma2 family endonuclease [Thermoactinospora rubra]
MVTSASRKARTRPTPAPQPEESSSSVEAPPATQGEEELTTLREIYDELVGRTKLRAEIINGRLIVSPLGTPEHQDIALALGATLRPHAISRGWKAYAGLDIVMDGTREPYAPDFVIAPPDAPRWGVREVFASGVIMVGEVVSDGSQTQDREEKRIAYAVARIPLYLLVDPIAAPPTVTIFSDPKDGAYTTSTAVTMGKPLHIPDPVDFSLDTSIFL